MATQIIYGGEACGYVLEFSNGVKIYHAGDTNVFSDMAIIRDLYAPKIVMLPIGDHFTMSPREAAYACKLLQPETVIPMHFGTFPHADGNARRVAETGARRESAGDEAGTDNFLMEGRAFSFGGSFAAGRGRPAFHQLEGARMTDQPAKSSWRMGGITVPEVEDYLYAMLPPRDEVLSGDGRGSEQEQCTDRGPGRRPGVLSTCHHQRREEGF